MVSPSLSSAGGAAPLGVMERESTRLQRGSRVHGGPVFSRPRAPGTMRDARLDQLVRSMRLRLCRVIYECLGWARKTTKRVSFFHYKDCLRWVGRSLSLALNNDFSFLLINLFPAKLTVFLYAAPTPKQGGPGGNRGVDFSARNHAAWRNRLKAFNLLIHRVA